MSTGRYFVVDERTGRRFCVEPIADRGQKIDGHTFTNGGIAGDEVKNKQLGGAIRVEDSVITSENGYATSTVLPAGVSPNDYIERLCRDGKKVGYEA